MPSSIQRNITPYLAKVLVLWQPDLSQEFGAPLLPLWPDGLVTIPPTQFMPRSRQVLQLSVATTPLWTILVPLKVVVDLWHVSQPTAIGMWFAGLLMTPA